MKLTKAQQKNNERIRAWLRGEPFKENSRDKNPAVPALDAERVLAEYTPADPTGAGQHFTPAQMGLDAIGLVPDLCDPDLSGFRILEPAAGIGGLVQHLAGKGAEIHAYDLDKECVQIGQKLYPDVHWHCEIPFNAIGELEGTMDLVVSNPPFGTRRGMASGDEMCKGRCKRSEHIFLELCVRALKPGGQAIIIAPINFVGSLPKAARAWLDKYAVLENGPKGFDDQHRYNPLPGQFALTNIEVYAFLFRKLEADEQPEAKPVKQAKAKTQKQEPAPKPVTRDAAQKRDRALKQYAIQFERLDRLSYDARQAVYCTGRDVALKNGEIVRVDGFTEFNFGHKFITVKGEPGKPHLWGRMAADESAPRDPRYISVDEITSVLLDEQQFAELLAQANLVALVEPWADELVFQPALPDSDAKWMCGNIHITEYITGVYRAWMYDQVRQRWDEMRNFGGIIEGSLTFVAESAAIYLNRPIRLEGQEQKSVAEQACEMTQDEFVVYGEARYLAAGNRFQQKGQPFGTETDFEMTARQAHRQHVEQALAKGKPVSALALECYPDLQPSQSNPAEANEQPEANLPTVTLRSFDNGHQFGYDDPDRLGVWTPYRDVNGIRYADSWVVWDNAVQGGPLCVNDKEWSDEHHDVVLGDKSLAEAIKKAESHFGVKIVLDGEPVWQDMYTPTSSIPTVQLAKGVPAGSLRILWANGTIVWTGDTRFFQRHGEAQFHAAWDWLIEKKAEAEKATGYTVVEVRKDYDSGFSHSVGEVKPALIADVVKDCYAEPTIPDGWWNPGIHLAAYIRAQMRKACLVARANDGVVYDDALWDEFVALCEDDPFLDCLASGSVRLWAPDRWFESLDVDIQARKTWTYIKPSARALADPRVRGDRNLLAALGKPKTTTSKRNVILSELADLGQLPAEYVPAEKAGKPEYGYCAECGNKLTEEGTAHPVESHYRVCADCLGELPPMQMELAPASQPALDKTQKAAAELYMFWKNIYNAYPSAEECAQARELLIGGSRQAEGAEFRRYCRVAVSTVAVKGADVDAVWTAQRAYENGACATGDGTQFPEVPGNSIPWHILISEPTEAVQPSLSGAQKARKAAQKAQVAVDPTDAVPLTPISDWDISWEVARAVRADQRCSRCRAEPQAGEEWLRGWGSKHPTSDSEGHSLLCPACQAELHRWKESLLQERLAEEKARKAAVKKEQKAQVEPAPAAEPTEADVAEYEQTWDVYFETGAVATVKKTAGRINNAGVLMVALARIDRGNPATAEERRKIIESRIKQLQKAA